MRRSVVITGSLAQRPGNGGHASVFLQWLLGFRRLGWEVLFLDRLEPEMCIDAAGRPCSLHDSENLRYLRRVMDGFDLGNSFALLGDGGRECVGRSREELVSQIKDADFLLNVMGFLTDEELLAAACRRVFLDIDPGFGQMWHALGLHDLFAGHDQFVTIGENIGRTDCLVPTCGLNWITTPQPVVLEQWPLWPKQRVAKVPQTLDFTSIVSWRGPFGPIEFEGRTFGLRVHEFRKFVALPQRTGQTFRVALDIHPTETKDIALLQENGWQLEDPRVAAADPWTYREFIQNSKAEFMVAKNMYVDTRGGWFSDRSLCYLASGKPVLAQDTGFRERYPCGEGLLAFSTLDEATAGVEEILNNYDRHARAARRIAEELFDSDKVLATLVKSLGLD